jgi:acetyltransferase-like isoleucine patch superfamily enzyme
MFNYHSAMHLYNYGARIYRRIWRILFGSNFKRLGSKSSMISPLRIAGAEYIEIGDHVVIHYKGWLTAEKRDDHTPRLIIEDRTTIGHFSIISCVRDVHIGKNVLIADRVYISDNLHRHENITLPIMDQPVIFKNSVGIGDDSWIGANVSIIGARIGKHCVIGANSVVTKDIPDYCVAAGAPAKIIKRYDFKTNEWQSVDERGE